MSDTLPLHTGRKADYKETMRLIVPFSSGAGAQRRLLLRNASGRQAPEGRPSEIRSSGYVDQLYQMDRRSGAAGSPGHYFFDSLENVRGLSDDPPARLGMRLFDAMWDSEGLNAALACAKRYF